MMMVVQADRLQQTQWMLIYIDPREEVEVMEYADISW